MAPKTQHGTLTSQPSERDRRREHCGSSSRPRKLSLESSNLWPAVLCNRMRRGLLCLIKLHARIRNKGVALVSSEAWNGTTSHCNSCTTFVSCNASIDVLMHELLCPA